MKDIPTYFVYNEQENLIKCKFRENEGDLPNINNNLTENKITTVIKKEKRKN